MHQYITNHFNCCKAGSKFLPLLIYHSPSSVSTESCRQSQKTKWGNSFTLALRAQNLSSNACW